MGYGSLVPFGMLGNVSYSHSIVTVAIMYHFRDKARYLLEIALFHILFYSTLVSHYGGLRRNIAITFGVERLERCGYSKVKKVR